MSPALVCLALTLVGVDLGYRPATNGGTEFIIQINPATLQALTPGEPIGIDVPREAQSLRPSHFSISLGNEQLPHQLPATSSNAPAMLPANSASRVMPAVATSSDGEPVRMAPPLTYGLTAPSNTQSAARGMESPSASMPPAGQTGQFPQHPAAAADSAATSGVPGLTDIPAKSSSETPNKPWLGMCLLVIALSASNAYVGWLFLETRQRYRNLLARTFSFARPAAEAS
jgi:hypothetical protein